MPNSPRTFDYEPVAPLRPREEFDADAERQPPPAPREDSQTSDESVRPLNSHSPSSLSTSPASQTSRTSPASSPSTFSPSLLLRAEAWRTSRGHAVSFAGLVAFTLALYFRPQDYYPALAAMHVALIPAAFTLLAFIPSQLSVEGNLTARPREVNLALLLTGAALLSIPLAVSPPLALAEFWETCVKSVLTFIFIVNIVRTERRLKVMLYLAMAITFLLCLLALNDYRLGNLAVEGYRVEGRSTAGMFENTNDLGLHLVTMLPIALALGLGGRGVLRKLVMGACAVLILATTVITFSRGAFLGLFASGLLVAWKLGRRNRVLVLGSLFLVVALVLVLAPGEYWNRIASIFDPSLDRFGSSAARSGLLRHSLVSAIANPVFGLGMGNFPLTSMRAQVTHNAYMQVAAELGFAAAVIYTMFIVAPLRRLGLIERETFAGRRASKFYYLSVGLQASLVAYMVSSFFVSVAFYLYIYYLVGYAVCLRRLYCGAVAEAEGASRPGGARLSAGAAL